MLLLIHLEVKNYVQAYYKHIRLKKRDYFEYKNEGKMIVMTSHHMEEIEKLYDVIVFMEDGKLKVN